MADAARRSRLQCGFNDSRISRTRPIWHRWTPATYTDLRPRLAIQSPMTSTSSTAGWCTRLRLRARSRSRASSHRCPTSAPTTAAVPGSPIAMGSHQQRALDRRRHARPERCLRHLRAYPQSADGGGAQPRPGIYLVRNAGCPEVVTGDCPVWRMVGRLDARVSRLPGAAPSPTPTVPPVHVSNRTTLDAHSDDQRERRCDIRSANGIGCRPQRLPPTSRTWW